MKKELLNLLILFSLTLTSVAAWGADTYSISGTTLTITTSGAMTNYSSTSKAKWNTTTNQGNITTIVINATVTSIGDYAFDGFSKVTTVTFKSPSKVTSIGNYAFRNCSALTGISLPSTITTIGSYTFSGCTGLKSVFVHSETAAAIPTLSSTSFNGITKSNVSVYTYAVAVLNAIDSKQYWTDFGKYYFSGSCGTDLTFFYEKKAQTLSIQGDGTTMTDYASYSNVPWYSLRTNILKISFSSSKITHLGNYAFYGCSNATSITLASSLTSIGTSACQSCSSATSISIPSSVISIGKSAFQSCSKLTSITIPAKVDSIGQSAFSGCTVAETVTFNSAPDTVCQDAFYNVKCTKVQYNGPVEDWLKIGFHNKKLTTYVSNPIWYSRNLYTKENGSTLYSLLKDLVIPAGITKVKDYCFPQDTTLKTVVFHGGVTSVGDWAFYGCKNVEYVIAQKYVYSASAVPVAQENSFYNMTTTKLLVPSSTSKGYYESATGWKTFGQENIVSSLVFNCGPEGNEEDVKATLLASGSLTISGNGAMKDYTSASKVPWYDFRSLITSVSVSEGVSHIGNYAFYGLDKAASISLPKKSLLTIGERAFYNCKAWSNVVLGPNVTSIGTYAFGYCTALSSLTSYAAVPPTLESIYVFSGVTKPNVTIYAPKSHVTDYQADAKWNTFTVWGDSKFGYCGVDGHVTDVMWEFTGTTLSISGVGAMRDFGKTDNRPDWESLKNTVNYVYVNPGVTRIGDYAFKGMSNVSSTRIPTSMLSIGTDAYDGCSSLTTTTLYNSEDQATYLRDWVKIDFATEKSNPSYYSKKIRGWVRKYSGEETIESSFTFPAGTTEIKPFVFVNNTDLTSLTIPASVTSIGEKAFAGCTKLYTINYNATNCVDIAGNKYVFDQAGQGQTTLKPKVVIGANVERIPAYLFCPTTTDANRPNIQSVTFADGSVCTSIGEFAFYGLQMTEINVPSQVTTIGRSAYNSCTAATCIVLPATLASLGEFAFSGCTAVASVTCDALVPPTATENCFTNINADIPVNVPNGKQDEYREAAGWSYFGNYPATSGRCGDDLTWSFESGTLAITGTGEMYDYDKTTNVPWYSLLAGIHELSLPEGMTRIGKYAFANCTGVDEVTIPSTVTYSATASFMACAGIKKVTFAGTLAQWMNIDFQAVTGNPMYNFTGNNDYLYVSDQSGAIAKLIVPSEVTVVKKYSFPNYKYLKEVVLHSGVTELQMGAFQNSINIKDIVAYRANVPSTQSSTFSGITATGVTVHVVNATAQTNYVANAYWKNFIYDATSLSGICAKTGTQPTWNLMNGVLTISGNGEMADYASSNEQPWYKFADVITDIVIENGVSSVGNYAFYNCDRVETIVLPESVTSIGSYGLGSIDKLASIIIPASVTNIGASAFTSCNKLSDVSYLGTLAQWCAITLGSLSSNPFSAGTVKAPFKVNGEVLTDIIIPEGVTAIGEYSFYGMTNVGEIYIPASVTSIGYDAFWLSGTMPARITCDAAVVPVLPKNPFALNLKNNTPLYVPFNLVDDYKTADVWKDFATIIGVKQQLSLSDEVDNSAVLEEYDGETVDVQLTRTLVEGVYNTLCLPFDLNATQITETFGAGTDIAALSGSSVRGDEFEVEFTTGITSIEAGVPYLIKPTAAVENPSFEGVEIDNTDNSVTNGFVDFIGITSPKALPADPYIRFVGAGNALYYPEAAGTLKGMRAYFEMNRASVPASARGRIVMRGNTTTGVNENDNDNDNGVKKVLRNGQVVILRGEAEYNVMGERL